jgi:ribosomal protein L37AE/L43A
MDDLDKLHDANDVLDELHPRCPNCDGRETYRRPDSTITCYDCGRNYPEDYEPEG